MAIIFYYEKFPCFNLKIIIENDFVISVEFLQKGTKLYSANYKKTDLAREVIAQLDNYLESGNFQFNLPLQIKGTEFQQKVWAEMLKIPAGTTLSYKDVAWIINSSPRAVGTACGKNKLALLIPCHRIIATQGKIGGFMHAVDGKSIVIKKWLLDHEQN